MHENEPCQVLTTEGRPVAEGKVVQVEGGLLELDLDEGSVDGRTVPQQEVRVRIRSVVKGECTYAAWVRAGQLNRLHIELGDLLDVVQLRESVREQVELHYSIERWQPWPEGEEDEHPGLPAEPTQITVLDLSAQGMRFETRTDVPIGGKFTLTLTHTRVPIEVKAEIVRKEQGGTRPAYGCRFLELSERSSDEIFRYILAQQSDRRRRSLSR